MRLRRSGAERIAAPLGLRDTGTTLDDGRLAQGHSRLGRPKPHWHFDALAGAGALRSTAADLIAFLRLHAGEPPGPLADAARATHVERAQRRAGAIRARLDAAAGEPRAALRPALPRRRNRRVSQRRRPCHPSAGWPWWCWRARCAASPASGCACCAPWSERPYPRPSHVDSIHLHDVQAGPRPPARQAGARGHLAVVPARREDRRARRERRRQVDPAAHHGRPGHRLPRRGPARPRRHRRACSSRSHSSTRPRTCAATSRTASASCATCSTASTSWRPTTPRRPPTSSPACRTASRPPTPGSSTPPWRSPWTRCASRPATPT